jgi:hypothetical protein
MPTISFELGSPGITSGDALELYGPTMNVAIGQADGSQPAGGSALSLPSIRYPALIDTGSRASCIDSTLAVELELPVVEGMQRHVAGILGTGVTDVYLAQISMPELGVSVAGHFTGVHLTAGGQPYRALIGRDILRNFTMVYDGRTGVVSLSND